MISHISKILFKKTLPIALLILSLISTNKVFAFETEAKQALVVDYDTGAVLYSKNAEVLMHPSSMSKIMTLYIAFRAIKDGNLKLEDSFVVSNKAWKMGGSRMFLQVGDTVKVVDLIRGIVVQSGNDACVALAEGMYGDEQTFVEHMNKAAIDLGLTNSKFVNSTGWPDENHLMTAIDLAKLARVMIKEFADFYPYFSDKEMTYNNITQQNRNTLIGFYGVDGIKTGHTDAGGYGVVLSAKRNGHRIIAVINGLSNMAKRAENANKILNYTFSNFQWNKIYAQGDSISKIKVKYGNKPEIIATVDSDLYIAIPKETKTADLVSVHPYVDVEAPIAKGDVLGEVVVLQPSLDSSKSWATPLVALNDVKKGNWIQILWQKAEKIWKKYAK